jgi:hypothetical protein
MEIALGQCKDLAECARVLDNPKYGALRAMTPKPFLAPGALTARKIDLTDNAPADERRRVRLNDFAYKLMSRNS